MSKIIIKKHEINLWSDDRPRWIHSWVAPPMFSTGCRDRLCCAASVCNAGHEGAALQPGGLNGTGRGCAAAEC